MADQLLKELGIADVTLHLNTLGDGASREAWRAALVDLLPGREGSAVRGFAGAAGEKPAADSRQQDPRDKPFLADAPKIDAFLSEEASAFFAAVTSGLDAAGVKWCGPRALCGGWILSPHSV